MKIITQDELYNMLLRIPPGAIPIGFTAITEVDKARQKAWVDSREINPRIGWSKLPIELGDMAELRMNPYYKNLYKLSHVNPFTNTNYAAGVNRRLVKEDKIPDFVPETAQYDYIGGCLVKYKNGNVCITVQFNTSNAAQTRKPVYLTIKNGKYHVVRKNKIAAFLPPPSIATNQNLEYPILWRTFGIKNIYNIALNGVKYKVKRDAVIPNVVESKPIAKEKLFVNIKPATDKQKMYMQERGIDFGSKITVAEATELITEYRAQSDENDERHIMDLE